MASQQVRLPGRREQNVLLMDHVIYGETHRMTADSNGEDEIVVPLILPPGDSALRFALGFEAETEQASKVVLSAGLRTEDASWESLVLEEFPLHRGKDRQPLHLGIVEIPGPDRESVAFLTLTLKGLPGTRIHFVNLAIDRS